MTHSSSDSPVVKLILGLLLIVAGVTALMFGRGIPELWLVTFRNVQDTWWPLLLIAAGILWWIADRRQRLQGHERNSTRAALEARND